MAGVPDSVDVAMGAIAGSREAFAVLVGFDAR